MLLRDQPSPDLESEDAVAPIDPALLQRLTAMLAASSTEALTSHAPWTGQPLASLPTSTAADVVEATDRARLAQTSWAEVPVKERAAVLLKFHDLVLDHQAELLDLIQLESGKARLHAFEEVAHVAMTCRYYARTAERHLTSQRARGVYPGATRVDVRRIPRGVVGIISPWNYPLTMAVSDGLAALMAGNAIVLKPDAQTALSALFAVELLTRAGLPQELWQVVHGQGATVGPCVVDSCDYVCFTGSVPTGRQVAQRAAQRLVGSSLELGGKNPMLVLSDAHVNRAAQSAVRACFSSAGQLCVSMERIYVADEVYADFVDAFVARVRGLKLSAGLDYGPDMGSLVSSRQLDTVVRHVEDAREKGATVLTGGRQRLEVGPLFYEPTVLVGVTPEMACYAEETFGPVVSIYRFGTETEAVAMANEGVLGLNACIYTSRPERGRRLAAQIRCGSVNVNEGYGATFGSIDAPMGGMRESGLGRRQGAEGIHRFTQSQTVATQRLLPIAPLRGMSAESFAAGMTGVLRIFKRVRRP